MSAPLFSKRHYEWLARWAGENLDETQINALGGALIGTNPNFQWNKFICRAEDVRRAKSPKRVSDLVYPARLMP